MKTQIGIVFETTSSYSIFLTPDGQFIKGIPVPSSIEVGEEVQFRPFIEIKRRKRTANPVFGGPIIAMAAALILFFSVLLPSQSKVSAFVQIDINPSIELGIDDDGSVQLFRGLNEDGVNLKRDIAFWKGKSLSWVLDEIVNRTESILVEAEAIEITTIYKKNVDHDTLEQVIETAVNTSTSKITAKEQEVKVIEASVSDREAANTEGISVQKYQTEIRVKKEEKQKDKKNQIDNGKRKAGKAEQKPASNDNKEQQSSEKGNNASQKDKSINEDKKQRGNKNESKQDGNNEQNKQKNNGKKDEQSSSNQKHKNENENKNNDNTRERDQDTDKNKGKNDDKNNRSDRNGQEKDNNANKGRDKSEDRNDSNEDKEKQQSENNGKNRNNDERENGNRD